MMMMMMMMMMCAQAEEAQLREEALKMKQQEEKRRLAAQAADARALAASKVTMHIFQSHFCPIMFFRQHGIEESPDDIRIRELSERIRVNELRRLAILRIVR